MKVNRLFEIIYLLLERKRVTAQELADYFQVSTRTIYRDIEDLSVSGIPVYMIRGKQGGISLLPDYILDKIVLTPEEKTNILSALQSLSHLDNDSMNETLAKLSHFFGDRQTGIYEIDFQDWGQIIKDSFDKSKEAIMTQKILNFEYVSSKHQVSQRSVEPYKLWFKERNWYLKAYCLDKNTLRIFRFSRMRKVSISDQSFLPREISLDISHLIEESPANTKIVMKINQHWQYRILDEFAPQNVVETAEGDFIVTLEMIEDDWLYGYILSFGSGAIVLEPDRVRQRIQQMLADSINNYLNMT